jgi:hypothetical protein
VAIECATGLTDRWIAHQPLRRRGRVGHEKPAPVWYLIGRRVHFVLGYNATDLLQVRSLIPPARIWFDDVPGSIVHWNPAILAEMRLRGARFTDFPFYLDQYVAALDSLPEDSVRSDYLRFRTFYFQHVNDPLREAPFLARLDRQVRDHSSRSGSRAPSK